MPARRLRRLRVNKRARDLSAQTDLCPDNLIQPYFVTKGKNKRTPVKTMSGIYRLSIDNLLKDVEKAKKAGIGSILLFGVSNSKDELASASYRETEIIQNATRALKKRFNDMTLITDVCLCGYTSHGHCGIVKRSKTKKQNYIIDNDATLNILKKIAVSHAEAGTDFVAPSAMMDGQVKAIRSALDKKFFQGVRVLGYSAKYASNFYWPFRDALGSSPRFGDRKSYQMDFRNSDEALLEIKEDIDEGADIVMVKPALAYLDIIYRAKEQFNVPIAAYNVSGEYAMVRNSFKDKQAQREMVLEILTSIRRAGADLIISYWAKEAASWLKRG